MSQYALIEEVWRDIPFPVTTTTAKTTTLDQENSANVKRTLNKVYTQQGIAGVKRYLDPSIVRDIQAEALAQHRKTRHANYFSLELSKDDWVYVLLGLFTILFAIDSKSL
jgi:hypothetical protein